MKILLVEDDKVMAKLIRAGLDYNTHTVDIAADGAEGSFLARNYIYDAIVLDYSLPKKNGLVVCKEIRTAGKSTPILFLSATEDVATKVTALDNGADDYMTKPFSSEELYARLCAITRRPSDIKQSILKIDDLELNTVAHSVRRADINIHLTRKELNLLEYLMEHRGVVVSRTLLLEHVWTAENDPFSNTVETHMRNLIKKINIGGRPNLIANIHGRGYVINTPENLDKIS